MKIDIGKILEAEIEKVFNEEMTGQFGKINMDITVERGPNNYIVVTRHNKVLFQGRVSEESTDVLKDVD